MKVDPRKRVESAVELPEARAVSKQPAFLQRGRASFRQIIREAANYKELKRTPYGLKPVFVFLFVGVIASLDSNIFGLASPEIILELDIDIVRLNNVLSALGLFLIFVLLGFAYLSDRVRRLPIVGFGTILNGIGSFFTSRSTSLFSFGISRSIDSFGGTALSAPSGALLADYYPPETRGKVFALSGVFARVVGLASPLLIAAVINAKGWRFPYLITAPALIISGILIVVLLKEPIRGYMERRAMGASEEAARIPEEPPSFGEAWRSIWAIRTLRRLFISDIPGNVGSAAFSFIFPFFIFQEYGLTINERALLTVGLGAVALPFGFMAGGIIDSLVKRNPQRVLIFSGFLGVLSSLFVLVIALTPPFWLVVAGFVFFGATSALIGPARSVLYVQILPAHVRALGSSVTVLAAIPANILRGFIISYFLSEYGLAGGLMGTVPFFLINALIEMSAAGFFDRDMRAALASQIAGEEWRKAKELGQDKMLVCRDVDVEYGGVQVLFGVDFDVREGEIIALLGTNGAGKSTLLRAISGTQEASNGAIVFDGRDVTHMPPHEIARRGVVHMPGGRGIFGGLSVKDNLMLGQWTTEGQDSKARLKEVYEIFPILKERANARAGALSGGEQQMLSLAQAFLSKPRLLMIDELSLGLSPAVVQQLIEIVRKIHQTGVTIIVVEQSVNVALTIAERAIFMEKGEVRFFGETRELLRRPDILRAVYVKGTGSLTEGSSTGGLKSDRELRRYELERARSILEVSEVSKSYGGVKAVDSVSFHLREGEILGLIGPNGAGKTTLFDLISGYQIPDAGQVIFDGKNVANLRADERANQRLIRRFQDARLFPSLTVYENMLVALDQKLDVRNFALTALQLPQARQSEKRVRKRAELLLDVLELGAYRDKFVKELSTGLRRIVDLACVLAAEPKVLLLDEPSSGIAQSEAEGLAPLLRRVRFETGCSMLVIEHDMPLISNISDELIALDQGRVVLRGTPEEVLNDERVIESYLGTSEDVVKRSGAR